MRYAPSKSPSALAIRLALVAVLIAVPRTAAGDDLATHEYPPCGVVSLYLVGRIKNVDFDLSTLQNELGPGSDGLHSFAELSAAARRAGLESRGLHAGRSELMSLPLPAIVQLQYPGVHEVRNHLAVVTSASTDGVEFLDAPDEAHPVIWSEFEKYWTGNLLVFGDPRTLTRVTSTIQSQRNGRLLSYSGCALAACMLLLAWKRTPTSRSVWRRIRSLAPKTTRISLPPPKVVAGFLLSAMLLLGTLLACDFHPASFVQPRMVLPESVMTLGEFPVGSRTIAVPVQNRGWMPLSIDEVESDCSCAVVKSPKVIPARSSDTLTVELNIAPGPRYSNISIRAGAATEPQVVSLHWHGKADVRLSPPRVYEAGWSKGTDYLRTIMAVFPGGRASLKPQLVSCKCDDPRVRVSQGTASTMAVRRDSSLASLPTLGNLPLNLVVSSSASDTGVIARCDLEFEYGAERSTIPLNVNVQYRDQPGVYPETLVLSGRSLDELNGRTRAVYLDAKVATWPVEVDSHPEWLAVQPELMEQGWIKLQATIVGPVPSDAIESEVVCRDASRRIVIPVRLAIPSPESAD